MHRYLKVIIPILIIGFSVGVLISYIQKSKVSKEQSFSHEVAADSKEVSWQQVDTSHSLSTLTKGYIDIEQDHWARKEILHLSELGIMSGDVDGQFRDTLPITYGQIVEILTQKVHIPEVVFSNDSFTDNDLLTHHLLAPLLVQAFQLPNEGEEISDNTNESITLLSEHGILKADDQNIHLKTTVSRATFAVLLYRLLQFTGDIEPVNVAEPTLKASENFKPDSSAVNFAQVTQEQNPIYIRSTSAISFLGASVKEYTTAKDDNYHYDIDDAQLTVTVRTLQNGSQFIFSSLKNESTKNITVDVFQKTEAIERYRLVRFDRYTIKRPSIEDPSYDLVTAPTGILQLIDHDGQVIERLVGQAYRSQQLSKVYEDGGESRTRELYNETENFSYVALNDTFYSYYTLTSLGNDLVDHWYVNSTEPLFNSDETMEAWMEESAVHFRKRNTWYTAQGPYNKMAITVEPMPTSFKGYGRNLLLVKEDRALELFEQQGDRYFETIVQNAFVNLEIFKGDDPYWYTEVTSTYLKDLYNITAPFIDTRFNEQIALFYYRAGQVLDIENYAQPLKNYANLLVEQAQQGNVIPVNANAYYLPDYYPINQTVKTHSSMNHMLGGIAILLHAYEQFGDDSYLNVAKAQMNAIAAYKTVWIRPNDDIWYKVDPNMKFVGTDYVHLTLEDLTYVYHLWSNIDDTYLPLLEEMIRAKSSFLTKSNKGHTEKIKTNLSRINMLHYLP